MTARDSRGYRKPCGCLTQIATMPETYVGFTPEITEEILKDTRLKIDISDRAHCSAPPTLTREELTVIAEWQDRLDTELREANTPASV